MKLGNQKELIESGRSIISGDTFPAPTVDLSSRIEVAKEVSACNYETSTCWGQEVFSNQQSALLLVTLYKVAVECSSTYVLLS